MGQYRIEIEAIGGNGCSREIKDGGDVYGCGRLGCPDCEVRRLVSILKIFLGNLVTKAVLTHWPGEHREVQDNLLNLKRKGSF